jgi:tRNA(Ile)-lysidine synthase
VTPDLIQTRFADLLDHVSADCGAPRFAVAVSGGSDSMALLTLAAGWARARGATLEAATVDHRLRPEARAEAEAVAAYCDSWFVPHATLAWTPPPCGPGLPAAARAGRYGLLADWMRARGLDVLLVGHTADDRLETTLMREARGGRDIAALRAAGVHPLWPEGRGLLVVRPLLKVRRAALQNLLTALGVDWHDDPSNDDTASPRIQARRSIASWPAHLVEAMLADIADRDAAQAAAEAQMLGDLASAMEISPTGVIELDLAGCVCDNLAVEPVLARLIAIAAGQPAGPGRGGVARLRRALQAPDFKAATLGGALIRTRRQRVALSRDPGPVFGRPGVAPLAPLHVAAGAQAVWDGRFLVQADRDLIVRPWGVVRTALTKDTISGDGWGGAGRHTAPAAMTEDGGVCASPAPIAGCARLHALAGQRIEDWRRALRILNADASPSPPLEGAGARQRRAQSLS